PRWIPDIAYRRVFARVYDRLRDRLGGLGPAPPPPPPPPVPPTAGPPAPADPTRRQFETWLAGWPDRLETDPGLRARGEQLKHDVLGSAALRDWTSALWQRVKEALRGPGAGRD